MKKKIDKITKSLNSMNDKEIEKKHEKLFFKSGYIKDFEVEISIDNPTFWQKITRQYLRNYKIKALTLIKITEITSILIDIPNFTEDFFKKMESPAEAILFINEHSKKLAQIVGVLLNEKFTFLMRNLTPNDIFQIMQKITELIDVESFFGSLGLSKMKMNLQKD